MILLSSCTSAASQESNLSHNKESLIESRIKIGVPNSFQLPYWGGSEALPSGLIYDIVSLMERTLNIDVEYVSYDTIDEVRIGIANGEIDIAILAESELNNQFRYSLPLFEDSVVGWIDPSKAELDPASLTWTCLQNSALCNVLDRKGYKNVVTVSDYSKFNDLWKSNKVDGVLAFYRSFIYFFNNNEIKNHKIYFDNEFGSISSRFVIQKDNVALENKLNSFINLLQNEWRGEYSKNVIEKYGLNNDIYNNWYHEGNQYVIKYTANNNNFPYSFFDKNIGEYRGLIHDIFNKIDALTPLRFVYVPPGSKNHEELLLKGDVDIVPIIGLKNKHKFNETIPFISVNFEIIRSKDFKTKNRIGILDRLGEYKSHSNLYKIYRNEDELFGDISNGLISHAYVNKQVLLKYISLNNIINFEIIDSSNFSNLDYDAKMFTRKEDEHINNLINAALGLIPKSELKAMMNSYDKAYYVRGYKKEYVLYSLALIVFIIGVLFKIYKENFSKMEEKLKGADQQAQLSEEQRNWLVRIIDHIPSAVCIRDENGKVTLVNEKYVDLSKFWGFTESDGLISYFSKEININTDVDADIVINCDEERLEPNHYNVINTLIESQDSTTFYMTVITDISVLKRKEEILLQANRASSRLLEQKKNFLAIISHELRTPISGVLGLMELLEQRVVDELSKSMLRNASASISKLKLLVDDILEYSKIDAEQLKINVDKVNIADELCPIIRNFESLSESKGLIFVLDWEPSKYLICRLDILRVTQIISNVLSNAVKFTESGYVSLKVVIIENELTFLISDTGIGMDDSEIKTIFNPFVQAQDNIARKFGGTGLGMTIVKNLVTLMKGSIKVSSEKDVGTDVIITIPIHAKPLALENSGEIYQTNDYRDSKWFSVFGLKHHFRSGQQYVEITANVYPDELIKKISSRESNLQEVDDTCNVNKTKLAGHVLVVEDDSINRFVFQMQLQSLGLTAKVVEDGLEALKELNSQGSSYNVVITDVHMPNMNGFDLADVVRAMEGTISTIPIIACTADNSDSIFEKALKSNINDVLNKPYELQDLHKVLSVHLQPMEEAAEVSPRNTDDNIELLPEWLQKLNDENRSLMAKAVIHSLKNIEKQIVSESIVQKDVVHRLKGSLGALGFTELVDICQKIEANNKDVELLKKLVDKTELTVSQAHTYLRAKNKQEG